MALSPGPTGWAGARRKLLDFMVQGKINRGRHKDKPAGWHSIRTNHCPPPPSPHFVQAGCPSCHPNNSVKALKASRVATPQDHNDPVYPVNSCFMQISDRTKTILFVTIFHSGCTKSPENSKSLPCSQKFLSIPGLWPPYQVTPQTAKSPLWSAYISPTQYIGNIYRANADYSTNSTRE